MNTTRTELEQLKDLYCDFYKDVHGIKARWVYGQDLTVEELQGMMDRLEQEWREEESRRNFREAVCEAKARERIQTLIEHGAKDVAMAIRWMHEAEETDGVHRYLDFTLGTRYGFVESVIKNGL